MFYFCLGSKLCQVGGGQNHTHTLTHKQKQGGIRGTKANHLGILTCVPFLPYSTCSQLSFFLMWPSWIIAGPKLFICRSLLRRCCVPVQTLLELVQETNSSICLYSKSADLLTPSGFQGISLAFAEGKCQYVLVITGWTNTYYQLEVATYNFA